MLFPHRYVVLFGPLLLAACVGGLPQSSPSAPVFHAASEDKAAARFIAVAAQVEPVAEDLCRRLRGRQINCDIQIAVDDRPDAEPNAFQTVDPSGRPYVVFTLSLIALASSADELAFVMGHEAAHHIAGHIPRRQESAAAGALLAGVLASGSGLTPEEVKQAQAIGADIGAQRYSQDFELEADALGTEIAWAAGFDPIKGAAFFDRLPDPGEGFLNSHPANSLRKQGVAETLRRLSGS